MAKKRVILDKISSILFSFSGLIGMIGARLKSFGALPILSGISSLIANVSLAFGYASWYVASLFYKDPSRRKDRWYGFSQYKHQNQLSALIGGFATILCIFAPALSVPIMWLYFISNSVWLIAEHHRMNNPPMEEENYSSSKQRMYVIYCTSNVTTSLLAAVSATLFFLVPSAPAILLTALGALTLASTVISIGLLATYFFRTYPPDRQPVTANEDSPSKREHPAAPKPQPRKDPRCFPGLYTQPTISETDKLNAPRNTVK